MDPDYTKGHPFNSDGTGEFFSKNPENFGDANDFYSFKEEAKDEDYSFNDFLPPEGGYPKLKGCFFEEYYKSFGNSPLARKPEELREDYAGFNGQFSDEEINKLKNSHVKFLLFGKMTNDMKEYWKDKGVSPNTKELDPKIKKHAKVFLKKLADENERIKEYSLRKPDKNIFNKIRLFVHSDKFSVKKEPDIEKERGREMYDAAFRKLEDIKDNFPSAKS